MSKTETISFCGIEWQIQPVTFLDTEYDNQASARLIRVALDPDPIVYGMRVARACEAAAFYSRSAALSSVERLRAIPFVGAVD